MARQNPPVFPSLREPVKVSFKHTEFGIESELGSSMALFQCMTPEPAIDGGSNIPSWSS